MRKKILLAEQSDATRSVAETILRQNGFDVVAVTEGAAAVDIIRKGRPDLVLVGAEMVYENTPLYQVATGGDAEHKAPVLVFAEAGREVPGVAAETVIPKPFHPRDLLDRVMAFAGRRTEVHAGQGQSAVDPLGEIDDDLLDNALGMGATGQINVTESEVMNQTRGTRTRRNQKRDEDSPEGLPENDPDELDRTGRIESIIISEDATDIRRPATVKGKRPPTDGGGGLDILPNQYGIGEPGGLQQDPGLDEDPAHDYHWFVSEMQREADAPPEEQQQTSQASPTPPTEDLTFTDPASTLEEFDSGKYFEKKDKAGESGGVERFIDEFKREVERFQADEPESLTLHEEPDKKAQSADWEEVVESVTPERVALFTRQLASELAERIAEKIVGKLDADKLAHMIKAEVVAQLRTRQDR